MANEHVNPAAKTPPSDLPSPLNRAQGAGTTTTKSEKRSANTLYQELSFQDDNFDNEENEITGIVHPGEYASSGEMKNIWERVLSEWKIMSC